MRTELEAMTMKAQSDKNEFVNMQKDLQVQNATVSIG